MNKIEKQRLLKLAAFLRKLPRERFDYTVWTGHDWKGKKDLSCGTTACALGWACTIPSFRKAGLMLNHGGVPQFRNSYRSPYEVAANFFGISVVSAVYLFDPSVWEREDTPIQVAKKIEKFVKNS